MALHFIISSSEKLNETYNRIIGNALGIDIDPNIIYHCQSVGKDSERPDMSGILNMDLILQRTMEILTDLKSVS